MTTALRSGIVMARCAGTNGMADETEIAGAAGAATPARRCGIPCVPRLDGRARRRAGHVRAVGERMSWGCASRVWRLSGRAGTRGACLARLREDRATDTDRGLRRRAGSPAAPIDTKGPHRWHA